MHRCILYPIKIRTFGAVGLLQGIFKLFVYMSVLWFTFDTQHNACIGQKGPKLLNTYKEFAW